MATIGERLAKARVDRNVTQKQLAAHLHISQAALSMIETGELDPEDGTWRLIDGWIKSGGGVTIQAPRGARGNYR